MTLERWEKMSLFEQLSNIHGEVERLISNKKSCDEGKTPQGNIDFYFRKIMDLTYLTLSDPKNRKRAPELIEEIYQIERYLMGEEDEDYIRRYWEQYTNALAGKVA